MTLLVKRFRLAPFETRTRCPGFKWSGIQMPRTGPKSPFETRNGPGFGCLLYWTFEYWNHLNTRQIKVQCSNSPVFRCLVYSYKVIPFRSGNQIVGHLVLAIQRSNNFVDFQMVTISLVGQFILSDIQMVSYQMPSSKTK